MVTLLLNWRANKMKEFTCIICPRGCRLKIDDDLNVSGNACPRGALYALEEIKNPTRTITSIVRVSNRKNLMVSVKTDKPIPKKLIFKVMDEINKIKVNAPVKIGDIVINNVLKTGSNVVVTKNID